MNRSASQCDERCFCDFHKCSFSMRGSRTLQWPPLLQFWMVAEPTLGQVLPVSTTKRSQKKFLWSNFRSPKVQYKERRAVDVFRNWQAVREKNRILYSSREACSKCAKSWKRLEDLHSLSLNFCLTKFVRTIERAFVQVSHSFANWFLNARVWISTHFRLHKTQAMLLF